MRKRVLLITAVAIAAASLAGVSYAWFFGQSQTEAGGEAAYIRLVQDEIHPIYFQNALPGERIRFGDNEIHYEGSRDAVLQFTLTGTGLLKPGSEQTKDWLALDSAIRQTDYAWDGVYHRFTDKRMREIMRVTPSREATQAGVELFASPRTPHTYYLYMEAGSASHNLLDYLDFRFTGEFGGMYKGSPSRQFEQESVFLETGVKVSAVQVTQEAISDVLGEDALEDVRDMVAAGSIPALDEWTYVG